MPSPSSSSNKSSNRSLPEQLQTMSRQRLQSALKNTEELLQKYRKSFVATGKKNISLLNFRLKNLERTLDRYANSMNHEAAESEEPAHTLSKKQRSGRSASATNTRTKAATKKKNSQARRRLH